MNRLKPIFATIVVVMAFVFALACSARAHTPAASFEQILDLQLQVKEAPQPVGIDIVAIADAEQRSADHATQVAGTETEKPFFEHSVATSDKIGRTKIEAWLSSRNRRPKMVMPYHLATRQSRQREQPLLTMRS